MQSPTIRPAGNIPVKVQRLNNSWRGVSAVTLRAPLNYGSAESEEIWQGVTSNYVRARNTFSVWRISVLVQNFCFAAVTCFSGVGRSRRPAACDVDVEDVHRGHGEVAAAQLAGPETGNGRAELTGSVQVASAGECGKASHPEIRAASDSRSRGSDGL